MAKRFRYAQQCMNPNYEVMKKMYGILYHVIQVTAKQSAEKAIVYTMNGTIRNLPIMRRANVVLHCLSWPL